MNGNARIETGRRCAATDCPTVLSIYNSDHLCFMHADVRTRARYERRSSPMIGRSIVPRDPDAIRSLEPTDADAR
jgi:hypothetical protein